MENMEILARKGLEYERKKIRQLYAFYKEEWWACQDKGLSFAGEAMYQRMLAIEEVMDILGMEREE